MFSTLTKEDKQNALEQYILSDNAITGNLFDLYKFYINYYQTKDLARIYFSFRSQIAKSLIDRNFRVLMRYCFLYNFFHVNSAIKTIELDNNKTI